MKCVWLKLGLNILSNDVLFNAMVASFETKLSNAIASKGENLEGWNLFYYKRESGYVLFIAIGLLVFKFFGVFFATIDFCFYSWAFVLLLSEYCYFSMNISDIDRTFLILNCGLNFFEIRFYFLSNGDD